VQQIDIKQAKVHLGDFIERAINGEDIIITKENEPILMLSSSQFSQLKKRVAGSAKGMITILDDFDKPLDDFKDYL